MTTKDTNPKDHAATTRVPLWLLSPIAKAHWALGQLAGLVKYGAWNWRKSGVRASIYLSAMERHIDKYKSGEEFDALDGTHHLGNIMACAAILLDAREIGKLIDDRPPSASLTRTYEQCEALAAKLFLQCADKSPRHYTIADTAECFGPLPNVPPQGWHPVHFAWGDTCDDVGCFDPLHFERGVLWAVDE
jgi:dATP/dGTP diphosphohydrolase